jgi:hypothetical protein
MIKWHGRLARVFIHEQPPMANPDKFHRHKAKRKAKRQAIRRQQSVSPVKRLAEAPGELECWASENFEQMGQMQLYAWKRAAGLSGVACFLIDAASSALKDAWVSMGVDHAYFEDILDRASDNGIRMRRITPDEARRWIAGGLRWAHDNGMRLPKDWQRPASLIGGVGDWHSADVSAFIKEFAGHPEDLRQRLVSEPLETYIQRPDINFIFNESAPYMDQATGRYSDWEDEPELDDELESIASELPEEEINARPRGGHGHLVRRAVSRIRPRHWPGPRASPDRHDDDAEGGPKARHQRSPG